MHRHTPWSQPQLRAPCPPANLLKSRICLFSFSSQEGGGLTQFWGGGGQTVAHRRPHNQNAAQPREGERPRTRGGTHRGERDPAQLNTTGTAHKSGPGTVRVNQRGAILSPRQTVSVSQLRLVRRRPALTVHIYRYRGLPSRLQGSNVPIAIARVDAASRALGGSRYSTPFISAPKLKTGETLKVRVC